MDGSPNRGGEGTIQQEVPQGLRSLAVEEPPAEETVSVSRTAAIADAEGVMKNMEQRVPRRHSHKRTMEERREAGDDGTSLEGNVSRKAGDVRVPVS